MAPVGHFAGGPAAGAEVALLVALVVGLCLLDSSEGAAAAAVAVARVLAAERVHYWHLAARGPLARGWLDLCFGHPLSEHCKGVGRWGGH